jgi:hypothetical protein
MDLVNIEKLEEDEGTEQQSVDAQVRKRMQSRKKYLK